VSTEGLSLLKRLEGFRAAPLTLADGRCVVGYGHVQAMAPNAPVTEAEAEAWLRADLAPLEAMLAERLLAPVSQPQFDALASFAFSIGIGSFVKSDVLRRFNAGEPIAAACAMDAWRKSRVGGEPAVLDALVRRRAAEKAVFLDLNVLVPAPSAFVSPEIDHAASILGQPTRVSALPTAATPAGPDDTVLKIASILAADPNTAHALKPPPVMAAFDDDEEEPVLVLTERAPPPNTARPAPSSRWPSVTSCSTKATPRAPRTRWRSPPPRSSRTRAWRPAKPRRSWPWVRSTKLTGWPNKRSTKIPDTPSRATCLG
jgi:GH24 family phage-related lysozyme (muramidase)